MAEPRTHQELLSALRHALGSPRFPVGQGKHDGKLRITFRRELRPYLSGEENIAAYRAGLLTAPDDVLNWDEMTRDAQDLGYGVHEYDEPERMIVQYPELPPRLPGLVRQYTVTGPVLPGLAPVTKQVHARELLELFWGKPSYHQNQRSEGVQYLVWRDKGRDDTKAMVCLDRLDDDNLKDLVRLSWRPIERWKEHREYGVLASVFSDPPAPGTLCGPYDLDMSQRRAEVPVDCRRVIKPKHVGSWFRFDLVARISQGEPEAAHSPSDGQPALDTSGAEIGPARAV